MWQQLKSWAAALRREILALWFACRDPRTPWHAKGMAMLIVAYALSPIDLIPDFIPVLGLLDEIVLLPLAIWLVLRMIPTAVMLEARARAQDWIEARKPRPVSRIAAAVIILIWVALLAAAWFWLVRPLLPA